MDKNNSRMPFPVLTIDNPNPERHLRTEWLLTNGLGGYAMGTVLGINTRRYHGLLVAAANPPVERIVALHSMIEQLVIPKNDGTEEVIDLSTQMFAGSPPGREPMLHPAGFARMIRFHAHSPSEYVEWNWQARSSVFTRSLRLDHESNSARVIYHMSHQPAVCRLRVRPLVSCRSFHDLDSGAALEVLQGRANELVVLRDGVRLELATTTKSAWSLQPQQWRDFVYVDERDRGLPFIESVWSPGAFECDLGSENGFLVSVSVRIDQPRSRQLDWSHSKKPGTNAGTSDREVLDRSAFAYPVRRIEPGDARWSIIAGYPWFSDWGRDAMIALPGLLLTTGRHDEALSVLRTFAAHMKHGLIPNRFADDGGPAEYNTVDASLWFVYAVWQWWQAANTRLAAGETTAPLHTPLSRVPVPDDLLAACRQIVHAYRSGVCVQDGQHSFCIGVTRAGLVHAGDENTQLTWMDAKRDGVVFTPRHGLAVDVNALWHNALRCLADMIADPMQRDQLSELAGQVALAFQMHFWWGEMNCLHDVLTHQVAPEKPPEYVADGSYRFPIARSPHHQPLSRGEKGDGSLVERPREWLPDGKLRPNQIIAAALPYAPLTPQQRRGVIDCVRSRFLTPFGLRTLDRADPDYRARYEGNLFERDAAYHNGTVWPWLIGPFGEAVLRADDFSESSRQEVRALLQPLLGELRATDGPRCLGQIAEVYDGDPPHRPSGCTAQAWSVAEVMRLVAMTRG